MPSEYILEMSNITKEFPGVRALDDVSFHVRRGEIHALVGENGAGKSTLMKILSGAYPFGTYSGDILIDGEEVSFKTVRDSEAQGIAIIYQELMLYPDLTIAENIMLHTYGKIISVEKIQRDAAEWMDVVGLDDHPETIVRMLGVGKKQMVEIAKALVLEAKLLILDEPTAALTTQEIKKLFNVLNSLKEKGVTCIYISHKLDEVFELCDTITVIRDGLTVDTMPVAETTESEVIKKMVGREITNRFPEKVKPVMGEVAMEVKNFCVEDYNIPGKMLIDNASFKVHYGEIVGIAGLMGAGRTEMMNSLFGDFKGKVTGEVYIDGEKARIGKTADAIKYGMGLATEDRKSNGLNMVGTLEDNITIVSLDKYSNPIGVMNDGKATVAVNEMIAKTKLKATSIKQLVINLSGGNQQKVVVS
jgi:D-xylose transport system ATP-binding protein